MEDQARKAEILVIEDEDNIAIALDYLLTREGYAQTRLATGAGAVDLICDPQARPGVAGCHAARSVGLRDLPERARAPECDAVRILMMTARGSAMERRKGLAMGADGFISKPFELKTLREEVRRMLASGRVPAPEDAQDA